MPELDRTIGRPPCAIAIPAPKFRRSENRPENCEICTPPVTGNPEVIGGIETRTGSYSRFQPVLLFRENEQLLLRCFA
jgi:hypothetical protein